MSLWKVAWRSIRQRSLVSSLTVLSMGLGVALVVSVLVVYGVVDQSFHRGGEGYDLIVGAKGGKEQLVLNTVFYLSEPIGNIPYSFYEELSDGKYGRVETVIPVCMGHTYQSFRVVGTVPDIFDLKYRGDRTYKFSKGTNFDTKNRFDAVMGAMAASRTKTAVGEKVKIVHGSGAGARTHDQEFKVVGILAPTGTPVDRAVFVNMFGFESLHSHEAGGEEEHAGHDKNDKHAEHSDEPKEVTAVLVCIRQEDADKGATNMMATRVNRTKVGQAVAPLRVISELFENVIGKLQWILLGMAVVTVIVAGIGIMVSIYNSMSDRRHEIAVMRALGASRFTVMLIILMESILLSLMGGAMGLALGHGAIWLSSPVIADWTGVVIGLLQFQWSEFWLVLGLVVLASAVGYLPAMSAYRTDVAKSLITTP